MSDNLSPQITVHGALDGDAILKQVKAAVADATASRRGEPREPIIFIAEYRTGTKHEIRAHGMNYADGAFLLLDQNGVQIAGFPKESVTAVYPKPQDDDVPTGVQPRTSTVSLPRLTRLEGKAKALIDSYEGQTIDVTGSFGAQSVDLAARYLHDLKGIPMPRGNAKDYAKMDLPGFCTITGSEEVLLRAAKLGDLLVWSGDYGAYVAGGYGHIAISTRRPGAPVHVVLDVMTQNPGPTRRNYLTAEGLIAVLRPVD